MICVGERKALLVRGDYHPAALYIGGKKTAGWVEESHSGMQFAAADTYNDRMHVTVSGSMHQQSTPTPDAPAAILGVENPSVRVYNDETEALEFTLPTGVLFGREGSADSYENDVQVDGVRCSRIIRRWGRLVLDGSEDWSVKGRQLADGSDWYYEMNAQLADAPDTASVDLLCTHYPKGLIVNNTATNGTGIVWRRVRVRWGQEGSVEDWKAALAAWHAAGTPVEYVYLLAEPQVILGAPVTLPTLAKSTVVESSAALTAVLRCTGMGT